MIENRNTHPIFFLLAVALAGCSAAQSTDAAPTSTLVPTSTFAPTETATSAPTQSPVPTESSACQDGEGKLDRTQYKSELLGREVPVWVYLPDCQLSVRAQLPVVYFLHGKPFDESHWPSLGVVEEFESGWVQGRWGPAVLVFPRAPEPLFSSTDGGDGSYEEEFLQGVLPFVEGQFEIGAGQPRRGFAGISRGGIWALEIGLRHPGMFTTLAALSPSLAVNYPREAYDPYELARGSDSFPKDILLMAGEQDWARNETERLYESLNEHGANAELHVVPGAHVDQTWAQALKIVLEGLIRPLDAG